MSILNGKKLMLVGLKGATGSKIVSTELIGQDENGGNIYQQTFDDGSTATFIAPKGNDGNGGSGSNITIDTELSTESENPVQNKVVTEELGKKLDTFDGSQETGKLRWTLYGQNLGEQVQVPRTSTPKEGAVACWASGDSLLTNLVRNPLDCTNKKYVDGEIAKISGGSNITIDNKLSGASENPVQNKVITQALSDISYKSITSLWFTGTADANGHIYSVSFNGKVPKPSFIKAKIGYIDSDGVIGYDEVVLDMSWGQYDDPYSEDVGMEAYDNRLNISYSSSINRTTLGIYHMNYNDVWFVESVECVVSNPLYNIKDKLGDIESSLDAILEIQNSLIGGNE